MALVKRKGITISRQLMDAQRLFPEATDAFHQPAGLRMVVPGMGEGSCEAASRPARICRVKWA